MSGSAATVPGGNGRRGARMECGVCWYVYDPALGDPVWRIDPGTTFDALPPHWSCPNCAALREQFLALDDAAPQA